MTPPGRRDARTSHSEDDQRVALPQLPTGSLTILTQSGTCLAEVVSPGDLSCLVADDDGVFGLRDAAQQSTVIRSADSGEVSDSVDMPGGFDLALGGETLAVAVRQRLGSAQAYFRLILDRRRLVELGRLELPGPPTSLAIQRLQPITPGGVGAHTQDS